MNRLAEMVTDVQYAEDQLADADFWQEFQAGVRQALDRLWQCEHALWLGSSPLAGLGEGFLRHVLAPKDQWQSVSRAQVEHWQKEVAGLAEPLPEFLVRQAESRRENQDAKHQHEARRRQALDEASRVHLQAVEDEFDLGPLWEATAGRVNWRNTDLIFQVQGPLWTAPLAWLSFGGQPLFQQVASTSTVVSLTLRQMAEQEARAAGAPTPHLLSAQWLTEQDWQRMRGLAYLHAALEQVGKEYGWKVWGLGDNPKASIEHLQSALTRQEEPFGLAVLGGHGHREQAGVIVADCDLWQGDGTNLRSLDLLVLVVCAVGRLRQEGHRDVEGLYAQLVAHGGRCVVAARWMIADVEAATFATELVHQYLAELRSAGGTAGPFARARALNRARRHLLDHPAPAARVSFHLAAAFDIYGLG